MNECLNSTDAERTQVELFLPGGRKFTLTLPGRELLFLKIGAER
jgi:hypothetical protein